MTANTWSLGDRRNRLGGRMRSTVSRARALRAKVVVVVGLVAVLAWGAVAVTQYARGGPAASPARGYSGLATVRPGYLESIDGPVQPLSVVIGSDGRVFVSESGGQRLVRLYGSNGGPGGAFAAGAPDGTGQPAYLAVNPRGEVFVSDLASRAVRVFSADGSFLREIASPFDDGWAPLGLGFDADGHLYVTDTTSGVHRVLVFDRNEFLVTEFGSQGTGEGQFWFPNAVAVDGRGRVYVSDGNNARIQVFSPTHDWLSTVEIGRGAGGPGLPRGIAIDTSRRLLFVVDAIGQDVEVYDIAGDTPILVGAFGADSDAPGFSYPNGIALSGDGRIFVTDREHDRVQVWSY